LAVLTCASCGAESPEGFRFCPTCGAPLGQPEPAREERKVVTILFADVTGSTALGEQLDPERLRVLLSAYFSAMSAVIDSWGGTVEKFIGDAVMAVFGIPLIREDDAERALRAALEMLARLQELNSQFHERHGITLAIRIGVNTGEVIAPVGTHADQRIVAGDAVNVAARLEQAAEPGSVMVGDRTYLATRDAFRFGPAIDLELKGKTGTVAARRVIEPLAEAVRGIPGLRAPMVGRDRELDALVGLLDEAAESRRPRLVVVYGPAGIGKSRLVLEFLGLGSSRHPDASVLRGRCLAAGQGITYWALGEILRLACRISLDDPVKSAQQKLEASARDALAPLGLREGDIRQTIFALAATAGIPLPGDPLRSMEPREVADEIARAWPRFAAGLTSRAPAIFVVEDLHWAEDQLLDMLERLLARTDGPLLVIATARPEFAEVRPGFVGGREDASSISLRPLTEVQGELLVAGLLSEAELPGGLKRAILATAEGNPLFVEEIVRRLVDEGGLVRVNDHWQATESAAAMSIPDTIHGLLAARIDALPTDEKRALQEAAVVGRIFWEEPVARALGNGGVADALLSLERKGLVFARPNSGIAGQVEFMFKHALVRDVAYASLPKSRRARAHAEHGAWIEELAGERLDEFAELVAHHYATAVAGEDADLAWADETAARDAARAKAFDALVHAGSLARRRFAIEKALELHQRALDLATSNAERARAQEELGDDHVAVFHGDEAVEAYRRAISLLGTDPDLAAWRARISAKTVRMITEMSGAFRIQPDPDLVDEMIEGALEAAAEPATRAWLLAAKGLCGIYRQELRVSDLVPIEERIGAVRSAYEISESISEPGLRGVVVKALGDLYIMQGSYELALDFSRRQLELLDQTESPSERAMVLFETGAALKDLAGRYEDALELAMASYEIAKDRSLHELMHATYLAIYTTYLLGRWDELVPFLDEHVQAFENESEVSCFAVRGGPLLGALMLMHRGDVRKATELEELVHPKAERATRAEGVRALVALAAGDTTRALSLAEMALSSGPEWQAPEARWAKVEDLRALREWDRLRDFLPEARNVARGMAVLGPACDRAEGVMLAASDDSAGAAKLLRQALDRFESLPAPFEAARTREELARLASPAEARRLLDDALEVYRQLNAHPHAKRVAATIEAMERAEKEAR
jgi:class 3 adenylate cyclase/tetratricopeptide (TPR) repeat protein